MDKRMIDDVNKRTAGAMGFTLGVAVTFIVLKLIGSIDWEWWRVLAPFWLTFLSVAAVFLAALVSQLVRR